jgi:L-ascorbate metabolism protein UlaG (beta-lactamase superfamily)
MAAADLAPIDAVLLSHDHHGDNLDAAGRALLPSAGAVVTTAPGAPPARPGRARPCALGNHRARGAGPAADSGHRHSGPPRPAAQPPARGALGAVRFPVTGPVRYSMTGREAVELCRLVRPRTVIPVHYEGWAHFREGREAVERALAAAPDVSHRVRWLPSGVAVDLDA